MYTYVIVCVHLAQAFAVCLFRAEECYVGIKVP